MNKICLGFVGVGKIASEHIKVINKSNDTKVVACTSKRIDSAKKFASKNKIPNHYNNINKMLHNHKLDGILVLVPPDQIFKTVKFLLPFKIPLLIEKPAGLNLDEANILAKLSIKHKCLNMIGYNRRYYSIFTKGLKEIKKKGPLFSIFIEGHERIWKLDSKINTKIKNNWIYSNSTHTLDLLRFFGGEISNLNVAKNIHNKKFVDNYSLTIKYKSGTIGTYISNWHSPGGWSIKLFGLGITVIFNPLEEGYWIDKKFNIHKIFPDKVDKSFKFGFYKQMTEFKKLIINKGKQIWPNQNLNDSYKTMLIINKIQKH